MRLKDCVTVFWIELCLASIATAAPPGFVKSTIPLDAPPVGLAYDASGVLWVLEGAPFGSNTATLRSILPDGTHAASFTVAGDDSENFFVGGMAYDPLGDRVLVTDNTADGRLYGVDKSGVQETIAEGIAGIGGVAVRESGEIFVTTSPFGSPGELRAVDRITGASTCIAGGDASCAFDGLGYGAGLAFDLAGDLVVQDADANTFQGRLQRLAISETASGLEFSAPVPLASGMQSGAGVAVDSEGDIFTTGSGGLFQLVGEPLAEQEFDNNGNPLQFATAIAFDAGASPFEAFMGPSGGRLAYMADFGFTTQDTFVTLLAPALPGDYNTDGDVDEEDYAAWRATFGLTDDLSADGSGNQVIDAADYVLWRKSFQSAVAPSATAAGGSVPEPGAAALALMTSAMLLVTRRWCRALAARCV